MAQSEKVCKKCGETKPLKKFPKTSKTCCKCYKQALQLKYKNITRDPEDRAILAWCYVCQIYLNSKYFNISNSTKNGFQNICKFHQTKTQIKRRNKQYLKRCLTLTIDKYHFFMLLLQPCVYCGTKENIGVDRIDNQLGYTKENCCSACKDCNIMKGRFTKKHFVSILDRITKHRIQQNNFNGST